MKRARMKERLQSMRDDDQDEMMSLVDEALYLANKDEMELEIWENERRFPFVGWKPPVTSLGERPNFSNRKGSEALSRRDMKPIDGYAWMVCCRTIL